MYCRWRFGGPGLQARKASQHNPIEYSLVMSCQHSPTSTILLPSSWAVRPKKILGGKNKENSFHRRIHWDGKQNPANNPTKLGWYFFYHPSNSGYRDGQSQPIETSLYIYIYIYIYRERERERENTYCGFIWALLGPFICWALLGPFICWALLGPFIWALGPGPFFFSHFS